MRRQISLIAVLLFTSILGIAQTVEDFKVKTLGAANNNYRKSPKRVLIADFQVQFQTALNLKDEKKGGKMWRKGIKGDAKAALTRCWRGQKAMAFAIWLQEATLDTGRNFHCAAKDRSSMCTTKWMLEGI